jgi:hypothetical protein
MNLEEISIILLIFVFETTSYIISPKVIKLYIVLMMC